jgi:hypothetical protein
MHTYFSTAINKFSSFFNFKLNDSVGQTEQDKIQELVNEYIGRHWHQFSNLCMDAIKYKVIDGHVFIASQAGKFLPMDLDIKQLSAEDWSLLQKISQLSQNFLKTKTEKAGLIDGSVPFLPGALGIFTQISEVVDNVKQHLYAKKIGDEVGVKEANKRYGVLALSYTASLGLASDLAFTIIEFLKKPIIVGSAKALFGSIVSYCSIFICTIELLRILSWAAYTFKRKMTIHTTELKMVEQILGQLGDKKGVDCDPIKALIAQIEKIGHGDVKLEKLGKRLNNALSVGDQALIQEYLQAYKNRFIYVEFKSLTDKIDEANKEKELTRQLGVKFTLELSAQKNSLISRMRGNDQTAFDQAALFLKDADWQATKKLIVYSLGALCATLAIISSLQFLPFTVGVTALILCIVLSTYLSYYGQKHIVESNIFGLFQNYLKDESIEEFQKRHSEFMRKSFPKLS